MSKFSSFLRKHSDEMAAGLSLFGMIFRALPLDPRDRDNAENAINSLQESAKSIARAARDVEKLGEFSVDKNTVKEALAELAPDLIGGLIEAAVRKAVQDATGVAPAIEAAPKPKRVRKRS